MSATWIDDELKDAAFESSEVEGLRRRASANLRRLREEIGVNQETFAKIMGVSRAALSYYENGSRTPDIDFINMVALKTECSTDYLLGMSPTMNQDYLDFRYSLDLDETEAERLIELCDFPEFKEILKSNKFSEILFLLRSGAYDVVHRHIYKEMIIWKCMKMMESVLEDMLCARIEYLKKLYEEEQCEQDESNALDDSFSKIEIEEFIQKSTEELSSNPFARFRKRMTEASLKVNPNSNSKEGG